MISDEVGAHDDAAAAGGAPWRRGLDVLDDYSGGGVLSEELADDLVNELAGLVGSSRPRRGRRGPHPVGRPGPQPSRPAVTPPAIRPRLTLVHGSGS
ncbi:hypothetical protein Acsp06_23510 [Actinomycetospora sp. NBRC 106375]|uniref:hypothetical protein n=1 Tax=Actinomycetospora sp. NBRC 106375 TaxID=3032207 RepID=UPI0024A04709|nr:hypothetical protein [Actinomycetospora sp. NBRC 106375]GLZ46166.1 hypothetical protein Acsp06_23510 [Actinomycetospora sp. NBRC 106375]